VCVVPTEGTKLQVTSTGAALKLAVWTLCAAALLGAAAPAFAGPGEEMYREFIEQDQIYADEVWQTYVQKIGQRLVEHSDDPDGEFYFYVLDISAVNAFALPDGYIFVNRGLLAFLESEDQLAAVLGHEIAHVTAAHARRRNLLSAFGNVAGFIGAVFTGRGEIMDVTNTAVATLVSGYGRDMELEADEIGGGTLARAGYNPYAMIEVIMVLKDNELFSRQVAGQPQNYHGLFASHPKNDKRLHDAVEKALSVLPEQTAEPVGDFWSHLDGLVYGNQASAGIVKDHAFYHAGLRFVVEFPQGWDVSNTTSRVMGRDPAGTGKGYITLQRQEPPEKEQTPKQYVTDTLKRDDVTGGEELEVNGYPVFIGTLDASKTKSAASLIAVLVKDGGVYLFKGEAGEGADVDAFGRAFRATVESFRDLTPADLRLANDQRIKVIEATPDDSYRSLAAKSSIKGHGEETLRLINGDHPNGEPRPGDLVKIVQ